MQSTRLLLPAFAIVFLASPVRVSAATADTARVASATAATKSDSVRAATRPDDARMGDEVRAQVEAHRAQARAFWQNGRNAQARREFLNAASLMSESGVLATEELLNAATIALVEERPLVAAGLMDKLAANAVAFGQPLVQAQALLEAATQYAAAGQKELALERYAVLRALLASPHIPDSFRSEVGMRIVAQR